MNKAPIEHEELKKAITELGGQKAVSKRFGIPYRTVQNWYRGERTPPDYVARMIVLFNEDEFDHLMTEWYSEDRITELKRKNEDLREKDQETLARYKSELTQEKALNERLQKQFDWALELAQNRRREVEDLEMRVAELTAMVEALEQEVKTQKKARETWVRQASMKL